MDDFMSLNELEASVVRAKGVARERDELKAENERLRKRLSLYYKPVNTTCSQCGTTYETGKGTGRRSSAKYCGGACRQKAYRDKVALETTLPEPPKTGEQ